MTGLVQYKSRWLMVADYTLWCMRENERVEKLSSWQRANG